MAAYTPKYQKKTPAVSGKYKGLFRFIRPLRKTAGAVPGQAGRPVVRRERKNGIRTRTFLLIFFLLTIGSFGVHRAYLLLVDSDIFDLTEVTVSGKRHVSEQVILEKVGLVPGINLLEFDARAARQRARDLDWIERLDIKISWPTRVHVQVKEYRPLALVNLETEDGPRLFYLDSKGVVFAAVESGEDIDYPVITGDTSGFAEGKGPVTRESPLFGVLRFLRIAARGNAILPVQAVSEVHVDPLIGLIVYLVDRPFPIYLGQDRIQTKYYRLVKILERLYRKKKIDEIKEIRMDYTENRVLVAMNGPVL